MRTTNESLKRDLIRISCRCKQTAVLLQLGEQRRRDEGRAVVVFDCRLLLMETLTLWNKKQNPLHRDVRELRETSTARGRVFSAIAQM